MTLPDANAAARIDLHEGCSRFDETLVDRLSAKSVVENLVRFQKAAFDVAFGGPYDAVLLTNFLHHFDRPTCESVMRKVGDCLNDDGCVITLEFVPNEDRITPPSSATFSLVMLGTTPEGDAYTFAEYQKMLTDAGFRDAMIHPLPPTAQSAAQARPSAFVSRSRSRHYALRSEMIAL